ncbi:cell wall-binding repeat-containing protein [Clostridium sp. JS66]|uniref:cell wall-binding repeat-containing protein n=1 Tax=Clostridium sp. JS66 TaxID=3064705 RepID=UPI00298E7AF3|nr:cell wall-binding repeat-containing protein [Clostridium sp. JS66]WPC43496.1 cell wall-binding repeat-containing protein [Clostridium sp. JS66]
MKKTKLLITSIVISIGLLLPTSVFANNDTNNVNSNKPSVTRLAGLDRYGTCNTIVQNGWSQSDYAILVNSDMFADAITASPLAKKLNNAPILLTEGNYLNDLTKDRLQMLGVKTVYIIGGTGVISNDVANFLGSINITSKRIGGADRYETSIKVAKELTGGNASGMFVVSGDTFEDALITAPMASKLQYPIILVSKNYIPVSVKNYAASAKDKDLILVGGSDVLGSNISKELSTTKVYNQSDKYSRNLALINDFKGILDLNKLLVASDSTFADALSGSALAGKSSNPIILLGNSNINAVSNFISKNDVKNVNVLGERGVISDDAVNSIIGTTVVPNSYLDSIADNTDLTDAQVDYLLSQLQGDWYKQIYLEDKKVSIPYDSKILHFNTKASSKYQFITANKNDAQLETIQKIKKISKNQYLFYGMSGTDEYDTLFTIDIGNNTITLDSVALITTNSKYLNNETFIKTDFVNSINRAAYVGKFLDGANNTYEFKDDLTAVWSNKTFKYKIKPLDNTGNCYLFEEYDSNGSVVNRLVSQDSKNARIFYIAVKNPDKHTDFDPAYVKGAKYLALTKAN